jgi:hypothetical protein
MFCRTSPNFKALGPQDGRNAHLTLRAVQEQPGRVRGSAPFPVDPVLGQGPMQA